MTIFTRSTFRLLMLLAVLAALSTPRPASAAKELEYRLPPGTRFTVVCTGGSTLMYGDNQDPTGRVTAIAGWCVPAGQTAPVTPWEPVQATYRFH